jgi:hypothetical protein
MRDFLGECNAQGMPLVDFQANWCAFCIQPKCSRSMAGKSLFDKRVATWEQRLFTNVPRMDPSDERYNQISAQHFMAVPGIEERTPEVGAGWIDPMHEGEETGPETDRDPIPEMSLETDPTEPAPPPVPSSIPVGPSQFQPSMNQGRMLVGAPAKPAQSDPWEPKKPVAPTNDVVIPTGARVRLGKPGVDPK